MITSNDAVSASNGSTAISFSDAKGVRIISSQTTDWTAFDGHTVHCGKEDESLQDEDDEYVHQISDYRRQWCLTFMCMHTVPDKNGKVIDGENNMSPVPLVRCWGVLASRSDSWLALQDRQSTRPRARIMLNALIVSQSKLKNWHRSTVKAMRDY
eukprot:scaffold31_cov198-Alexandrium_tamarense.AAC.16